MKWLRRLFRRRRDPRALDPVRPMVTPDDRYAQARRQTGLDYVPEYGFLRDRPTCQRINMAQWKLERARRRARSAL